VVGVSGDLIEEYLAQVRAQLRTSDERAAQILAEGEDHLRESAEAGVAIGMTEREAQEAAISAFGSVRAVVRAHRRPAATATEVGMAAWKLAAIYLLTVPAVDLLLTTFLYEIVRTSSVAPGPVPHTLVVTNAFSDVVPLIAGVSASASGGLALLLGYRRVRRSRRRRGQPVLAPLGGFFPLGAAIFMLFAGPVAGALIAPHVHLPGGYAILAAAGVVGSVVVSLGYAAAMVMALARQRRDGGTTDQEAGYAG
jgi:hypothetical protein